MSDQESLAHDGRKVVDSVRIALGVAGIVAIVLGAIIIFNPAGTGLAMMGVIAIVFAVLALILGIVYLSVAIFSRTLTGGKRVLRGLLGVVYLVAGIVILMNLGAAATVLAIVFSIVVGISWIVEGVLTFTMLSEVRSKGLSVFYAIVSIIAGVVLVLSPLFGAATLWLLLGIALVVMGVVQVVRAFMVKPVDAPVVIVR